MTRRRRCWYFAICLVPIAHGLVLPLWTLTRTEVLRHPIIAPTRQQSAVSLGIPQPAPDQIEVGRWGPILPWLETKVYKGSGFRAVETVRVYPWRIVILAGLSLALLAAAVWGVRACVRLTRNPARCDGCGYVVHSMNADAGSGPAGKTGGVSEHVVCPECGRGVEPPADDRHMMNPDRSARQRYLLVMTAGCALIGVSMTAVGVYAAMFSLAMYGPFDWLHDWWISNVVRAPGRGISTIFVIAANAVGLLWIVGCFALSLRHQRRPRTITGARTSRRDGPLSH